MDDYFIYNGIDSRDLCITLQSRPSFSASSPVYESQHVAGRNGNLTFWDGSYSNVEGRISCFQLTEDAESALIAAQQLSASPGYHRLEVSNEPNVYRQAILKSGFQTDIRCGVLNPAELKFDCKPQKFLKSGEEALTIPLTTSQIRRIELDNPYLPCSPVIEISGTSGVTCNLTVNSKSWAFKFQTTCTVIFDGESQDVYSAATNYNQYVTGDVLYFPELVSGSNVIIVSGCTSAKIYPRWYVV